MSSNGGRTCRSIRCVRMNRIWSAPFAHTWYGSAKCRSGWNASRNSPRTVICFSQSVLRGWFTRPRELCKAHRGHAAAWRLTWTTRLKVPTSTNRFGAGRVSKSPVSSIPSPSDRVVGGSRNENFQAPTDHHMRLDLLVLRHLNHDTVVRRNVGHRKSARPQPNATDRLPDRHLDESGRQPGRQADRVRPVGGPVRDADRRRRRHPRDG